MKTYTEGCFICGEPLIYFETAKQLPCYICGTEHSTNASCEDGHYVCDSCHAEKGFIFITHYASQTTSKNPVVIATEMMQNPHINMHGPEHHYLVAAALLAAYKNVGGQIDLQKALQSALQRAKRVPGGICGMWGSCGAGIATGIFVSVITGATPLSEAEWSLANHITSRGLAAIAANGGPRCCKRNTYLAITQAVEFVKEQFNLEMKVLEQITCQFASRNKQCRLEKCLYSPCSTQR